MSCKKNKQKLQEKVNLVKRRKLLSFFTKKIDQKKRHENISFFTPQNYHPKYDEKRQQKNCLFLTTNYTLNYTEYSPEKMNHKNGLKKNRRLRGFLISEIEKK